MIIGNSFDAIGNKPLPNFDVTGTTEKLQGLLNNRFSWKSHKSPYPTPPRLIQMGQDA